MGAFPGLTDVVVTQHQRRPGLQQLQKRDESGVLVQIDGVSSAAPLLGFGDRQVSSSGANFCLSLKLNMIRQFPYG